LTNTPEAVEEMKRRGLDKALHVIKDRLSSVDEFKDRLFVIMNYVTGGF